MHTHAHIPQMSLQDVHDLQDDVRSMPGKKAAIDHLAEHYSHCTRSFLERNLDRLLAIEPEQLVLVIGYPDPTGEIAVRRALATA